MQDASSAAVLAGVINTPRQLFRCVSAARVERMQNRRYRFAVRRHSQDAVPECIDGNRGRPYFAGAHLGADWIQRLRRDTGQFRSANFPAASFAGTRLIRNVGFETRDYLAVCPEQKCPRGRTADIKREDAVQRSFVAYGGLPA